MEVQGQGEAPGFEKADEGKRIVAAAIDGALAAIVMLVPFIGGLVAAAYVLVRDGLDVPYLYHQSFGKKIMGIQAVTLDGHALDLSASIMRNLPLAVGYLGSVFVLIPILGWLLAVVVGLLGVVLGILEIVLVLTDPDGRRLGDKLAETWVVIMARRPGSQ